MTELKPGGFGKVRDVEILPHVSENLTYKSVSPESFSEIESVLEDLPLL
jgi:hypothetical protein